jgi:hypothetical protein
VACGSGDAQTLAVTESGLVYSWGDGDYGKLGKCISFRSLFLLYVVRVFTAPKFSTLKLIKMFRYSRVEHNKIMSSLNFGVLMVINNAFKYSLVPFVISGQHSGDSFLISELPNHRMLPKSGIDNF